MAQLKLIVTQAIIALAVAGTGCLVACGSDEVGPEDAVDSEGGNGNDISATGGSRVTSQSSARTTGGRAATTAAQNDFTRGGGRSASSGANAFAQGGNFFPFNQGGNTGLVNTTGRRTRNQGGADAAGGSVVLGFGGFSVLQGGATQEATTGGRAQRTAAAGGSSEQTGAATGGRGPRNTGGSEQTSATGGRQGPTTGGALASEATGGRSSITSVAIGGGGRAQGGSSATTAGRRTNRGGAGGNTETQPAPGVAGVAP